MYTYEINSTLGTRTHLCIIFSLLSGLIYRTLTPPKGGSPAAVLSGGVGRGGPLIRIYCPLGPAKTLGWRWLPGRNATVESYSC